MVIDSLISDLKRHEGLRLKPYRDIVNVLTIGYGRNLDANGIRESEAEMMLRNDVDEVIKQVYEALPWVETLNDARKSVIFNMTFNLGLAGLLKFKGTLAAIQSGDYATASTRMLSSKWAGQVGHRATELADKMRSGN
jgi:lysozyme